ncbi:MAG: ATP-binding protein [Chloroflexi bacterium]|nr:ATP-binding protein [Chloroflexota bacterium]
MGRTVFPFGGCPGASWSAGLQLTLLFGAGAWLHAACGSHLAAVSCFGGLAVMAAIGNVAGPFTGGNEAEWTRYLEKLVKSERDRLMGILTSMKEGVAIVGSDRKIRFMNPSMVKDFGDGVGNHCWKHFRGLDEPCNVNCKLPQVIKGATERWEYAYPDGRTYEVISSPFADADQVPCMLATFRNVTHQKQIELELVRLNQLKSDLLSQKTKELEEISQEVAKLEEDKHRLVHYLRVVAHDLGAPLSATQSCLWAMLGGYAGDVTDEQRDLLDRSTRRIDGLLTLIGDLLDIPRIESGQIVHEMEDVSLNTVVETAIEGLHYLASQKGLLLKVELPQVAPVVHGSSRRLQQVVTNLVSNAISYTEEGVVLVRLTDGDGEVRLEVLDSGVGILPEELPQLFQDFFRGSNVEAKGTGLGLSISKRIVEAHGGRIWAESPCPETNKGSMFIFTLPKSATRREAEEVITGMHKVKSKEKYQRRLEMEKRKPRILMVDDDVDFVEAVAKVLRSKPYEVVVAHNGKEGLEKAKKEKPDLVLLDVLMPVMDGFDFAVMALTNFSESLGQPFPFEVAEYVRKPISPKDLLTKVDNHLKKLGPS